jgi:hypothetical protein
MKKIHFPFAVLVALLAVMLPLAALGATVTVDGIEWSYSGSTLYGPTDKTLAGAVVIPSTLGSYSIKAIGTAAFSNCTSLTHVEIPAGVTSIGHGAFRGCSSLTNMTIPNGVTRIGDYAFYGCTNLVSVTIPEGVTIIDECTFCHCSSLTSVVIPNGVTHIGDWAFDYCYSLTNIVLPDSLISTGWTVFLDCMSLTSLTIPSGVKSIGSSSFSGCSSLSELIFCGGVPEGLSGASLPLENTSCRISFPESYGAEWNRYFASLSGIVMNYEHESSTQVTIVSAQMRPTDPTIMDVVYKVTSTNGTVNVRALAFEDGEHSFAKVVRPETFVEGTGANLGDGIAANVEHTLSWRVSADWAKDLTKVKFEILMADESQIPMELVTIPATVSNAEMTINVRRPSEKDIFNALLWHYADYAEGLTVANGELKHGSTLLAKEDSPANTTAPISYVYNKMGYDLLTGDELDYARRVTRWPLSTTGSKTVRTGMYSYMTFPLSYLQYGILRGNGE